MVFNNEYDNSIYEKQCQKENGISQPLVIVSATDLSSKQSGQKHTPLLKSDNQFPVFR